VNRDTFLPRNKYYSLNYNFISVAGEYVDCVVLSQNLYNSAININ